jgi:hypothetical protein
LGCATFNFDIAGIVTPELRLRSGRFSFEETLASLERGVQLEAFPF